LNRIALQGAATEPAVFCDPFFSHRGIEMIIFVVGVFVCGLWIVEISCLIDNQQLEFVERL